MFRSKEIDYIHFDTIDSTHEWAKKNISSFHPDRITAITATLQTAGRGRIKNRAWISKEGNLHFTGFFYLPKTIQQIANLSQVIALSMAQLLEKKNVQVQIKWPNDLLYDHKKIGGAMTELLDAGENWGCIIGLGLNVNASVEADQPTTSLKEISRTAWDINTLKIEFLKQLQFNLILFCEQGLVPFLTYFNQHLAFKGNQVSCIVGEKKISGLLYGITNEGKLLIKHDDGSMISLFNGEMHTLREIIT